VFFDSDNAIAAIIIIIIIIMYLLKVVVIFCTLRTINYAKALRKTKQSNKKHFSNIKNPPGRKFWVEKGDISGKTRMYDSLT
jgi:hypothetical protein